MILELFTGLIAKHFICDFLLQTKYQYSNKGTYGHPGGLLHVIICMFGTWVVLYYVLGMFLLALPIIALEGIIHYHIDWAKMNLNTYLKLSPTNSEQFWWLLGFDQFLHYMTYVAIVWVCLQI